MNRSRSFLPAGVTLALVTFAPLDANISLALRSPAELVANDGDLLPPPVLA